MPESDGVMDGENATEYADFHTASEFTEGIAEREEDGTDHATKNKVQETDEGEVESNAEKNAAMTTIHFT